MKYFKYFALFILAVLPGLALAATNVNPANGNAWDLFVFGNGRVIEDILISLKLLMIPDAGDSGFSTLLTFLATLGFLLMAIAAGFNPAQNLLKMFTYILVVWGVTFASTKLTANITVNDPVNNYYNTVERVPFIVGVPAALVSNVGQWMTKTIESYFRIPAEFKISQGNDGVGGSFNLFGTMMREGEQFVIRKPELKKSLGAYMGDCVVPAIALGKFTDRGADGVEYSGNEALMRTTNMMELLSKAAVNQAILTKYYPPNTDAANRAELTQFMTTDDGVATYSTALGVVVPCALSYKFIAEDMTAHADEMLAASGSAWAKTGVMTTYETAMSATLAQAASGGQNAGANGTRPQGFILQQAMTSSMSGAFRESAAAVGNNEFLTAAAIAQAEQSQKSAWATSAVVFNNMMGYVYTVLQAFIFALIPIVIIALMLPGLGKAIFSNYGMILIWLALWTPMLAIVNYMVTLFGIEQVRGVIGGDGGWTLSNRYVVSEKVNDLMLAAQFLGTMVPLLAWGVVKGSLAFTEFISHGMGGSHAQQAGTTAATGNMSMNNMSMDNASMNKFNTASSSAVGTQSVLGYTNAGALDAATALGGGTLGANSSNIAVTRQQSQALQQAWGEDKRAVDSLLADKSLSSSVGSGWSAQQEAAVTAQLQKSHEFKATTGQAADTSANAGTKTALSDAVGARKAATVQDANKASVVAGVEASAGFKIPGVGGVQAKTAANTGVEHSVNVAGTQDTSATAQKTEEAGAGTQVKQTGGLTEGSGKTDSLTTAHKDAHGTSQKLDLSTKEGRTAALQELQSYSKALTASISNQQSVSMTGSGDLHQALDAMTTLTTMSVGQSERGDIADKLTTLGDRAHAQGDAVAAKMKEQERMTRGTAAPDGVTFNPGSVSPAAERFINDAQKTVDRETEVNKVTFDATHQNVAGQVDRTDNTVLMPVVGLLKGTGESPSILGK